MFRLTKLLPLLLLSTRLIAAEPIELSISVTCAPLQAWRALCVDWQVLQWNNAQSAFFEVRPEGPWRITHYDNSIEEGVFAVADPGRRLTYSYVYDEQTTEVDITFLKIETGCEVNFTLDDFGMGRSGENRRAELLSLWEERLPLLSAYLDRIPGSYLRKPDQEGPAPAVLLLHDRFGLNRSIRYLADSLAAKGYAVLAVDMFKGDATSDMTQAARFLELVNGDESIQTARDGFNVLRADKNINRKRIAVFGIGYGGSAAVRLAAQVPELRLCINWYGADLPGEDQLPRIAAPVFGVFASPTPTFAPPVAENFNSRLVQAGIGVETVIVLGSDGFADPAYGTTYNPSAMADAWVRTIARLDRTLKL